MTQYYRIAAFARLGGVSVRTLQYYDRIGLLKPARLTESGHRLYQPEDLLRLQQIVTLKWMGFSLARIKTLLDSPDYDLRQAFIQQKAAIDAQIARLQKASQTLQQAIDATRPPDTADLQAIIRAVGGQNALMDTYYDEVAQAGIALRGLHYTQEQLLAAQQAWQEVYDGFAAVLGCPLDHPEVMRWAAKMDELIQAFTGGDAATEESLRHLVRDASAGKLADVPHVHEHFSQQNPVLMQFMQQALQHYRKTSRKT